jgi:hypothetical protein
MVLVIIIIGTSVLIVVGGTTGTIPTDSMSSCNEHDSCMVCIDCDDGAEDRGGSSWQVGGQFFRGSDTAPPIVTLGPSRPLQSGGESGDASEGNPRVLGVRTCNLQASYTEEEGVK